MQNQQHSDHAARPGTPRARQTNNDANSLHHPLKRLSLHTAERTPLPQSPALNSPRTPAELRRTPSTPNFAAANAVRRSPSVASFRASSPAPSLGRKTSTSSLRGEPPRPGTPRGVASSRRSSFNPAMQSSIPKSPLGPQYVEEKPPLRACDVAEEYFKRELSRHEGVAGAVNAGTVVIMHDQCYGHRFSRPRTSKADLACIMERPERILASTLGIATAYVRLGERHADGNNPPHPHHNPPERVPFKLRKTSRMVDITSPVVTNVHGTKWMAELKSLCDNAGRKLPSTEKRRELKRDTLPGEPEKELLHTGDLYLCPESLNAFQGALGGVLDAVDAVFQGTSMGNGPSRAFVSIRPPGHHCSADFPSGFCWLNNVHVGIEHATMAYGLTHAAIIDFDLHHGDGSQAIAWAHNQKVPKMPKNAPKTAPKPMKTSIGYFSLHDINSYPCEEGDDAKVQAASLCIDNAHGQSVWNVHLESWQTLEQFWAIYEDKYLILLEKVRQYLKHHTQRLRTLPKHPAPKAAIFISAGFDASEWETQGMQRHPVNVPTEFYARFTRDVVRLAEEEGTSAEGRVISVLEGGYSDRALTSGVFSHLSGLTDGQVWTDMKPKPVQGLSSSMSQRLGALSLREENEAGNRTLDTFGAKNGDFIDQIAHNPVAWSAGQLAPVAYKPDWWDPTKLTELENLVNPPAVVPKQPTRATGPQAHFSSPTQSYVAKVVDPSKINRSLSAKYSSSPARASTPPPPPVDWATAAHALSGLLIPSDRQTRSHRPEDLAEVKVKKEKPAPVLASVRVDGSGRQLRGRKAAPLYADPASDDEKASRASRRQTIADFAVATSEPPAPSRSVSRRMSIASSVSSVGDSRSVSRAPSVAASRRSVAPSVGSTNGVPVKKARGTAAAARAPQRPPVPRVPSSYSVRGGAPQGKENDDLKALTSGMGRITLRMPTKEEHDAREAAMDAKQKAASARKPPAARAPKPAAKVKASTTAKKGTARLTRTSKPASPVDDQASIPDPEAPRLESAATAPLIQPQPVAIESASVLPQPLAPQPFQEPQAAPEPPAVDCRVSSGMIQPPTDLHNMAMTPEQIREQLPMPSFVNITEPLADISPPPRADTPPPPPPSTIPHFANYTPQSFTSAPTFAAPANAAESATLQWVASTNAESPQARALSPASKRSNLPVFSADGVIPFASQQGAGAEVKKEEEDIWEVPETPGRLFHQR